MTGAEFSGRVIWVTGAGQGMGARHAHRFAEEGARVACIDKDGAAAARTGEGIGAAGGEAVAVTCDVADWESVAATADRLAREVGRVDVVVANAGVLGPVATVEEVDPEAWNGAIAVNLTGVFHTAKAAIPQMRGRSGAMVLVSSISGLRGYAGAGAYNASKHGVIGLMRTLANELAADGIRVNAVCPGWVDTPMFDAQVEIAGLDREEAIRRWSKDQLLERLITPDEVSNAVLWLASSRAAMITGVVLPVDGGMVERTLPPARRTPPPPLARPARETESALGSSSVPPSKRGGTACPGLRERPRRQRGPNSSSHPLLLNATVPASTVIQISVPATASGAANGSPSRTTRSASLPVSSEPRRSSMPIENAASIV